MKKVLCINNGPLNNATHCPSAPELVEGDVYTVLETKTTWHGSIGYYLQEVVGANQYAFNIKRFVPISDIDETELLEQRQHESVNNETTV